MALANVVRNVVCATTHFRCATLTVNPRPLKLLCCCGKCTPIPQIFCFLIASCSERSRQMTCCNWTSSSAALLRAADGRPVVRRGLNDLSGVVMIRRG